MPDYMKLFYDKRLNPSEPHHLEYIKGRLANMKVEDPKAYEEYSAHYGVSLNVEITKSPDTDTGTVEVKVKKLGRPSKSSL